MRESWISSVGVDVGGMFSSIEKGRKMLEDSGE